MVDQRYLRPGFDFALAHAIEEAGEFLAAAGKTQRWGRESVNPDLPPEQQETNEAWMLREIADLRGSLDRLLSTLGSQAVEPEREVVERAAIAMCNAAWADVGEDWSLASDEQKDEFRLMARAALATLPASPIRREAEITTTYIAECPHCIGTGCGRAETKCDKCDGTGIVPGAQWRTDPDEAMADHALASAPKAFDGESDR